MNAGMAMLTGLPTNRALGRTAVSVFGPGGAALQSAEQSGRVYIDGRCELYGVNYYRQYLQFGREPALLQDVLMENDIRTALVLRGSALDRSIRALPEWSIAAESVSAVVHRRGD